MHLVLAVPVGIVIGLSLGALGGGGSILTVPALVYILGQGAHGATTASLVIVGVTSLAGAVAHSRAGRVRVSKGLVFGALGVAGSFVGARLSAGVSADVLLGAFAGLVLVAAGAMGSRVARPAPQAAGLPAPSGGEPDGPAAELLPVGAPGSASAGRLGTQLAFGAENASGRPLVAGVSLDEVSLDEATLLLEEDVGLQERAVVKARPRARSIARVVAAATVVGLLTGFFGVGGGFVVVPALVLSLGFEMPEAVGTSLLVIVVNTAAALLGRLGTHADVHWSLVAVFVVAAVAGAVAGNRVASVVKPKWLALSFTLLLVAVGVYTGARSLPHLL